MSPELSLYTGDEEEPRLRIRAEPKCKPEPYFAAFVASYVHGNPDEIWEAEQIGPRFDGTQAEVALDYAERLVRDPRWLKLKHTVKNAAAVVVNDHAGKEWGRFPILGVVAAPEKKERRVGWRSMVAQWFYRQLGY